MEIQPYPFHTNYENGKTQMSQKQIQFVSDISRSHVELCQNRIKEYPERVLYNKGGENKNVFNVYKHQVALRLHNQHDNNKDRSKTSIVTCLNGLVRWRLAHMGTGKRKKKKEGGGRK